MVLRFEVGDRVRLTTTYEGITEGTEGTVVKIWEDDPNTNVPYPYSVRFAHQEQENGFDSSSYLLAERELDFAGLRTLRVDIVLPAEQAEGREQELGEIAAQAVADAIWDGIQLEHQVQVRG